MDKPPVTAQMIALDISTLRKQAETRYVLDRLRQTAKLYPKRPEDIEAVDRARIYFTDESAEVIAPLIEAVDILWAILSADGGCAGHRQCAHSMEPWDRARELLYRHAEQRRWTR